MTSNGLKMNPRLELRVTSFDVDPSELSFISLRFYCFDCDVRLEDGNGTQISFSLVPAIQFLRSLWYAMSEARKLGSAQWDIFDRGDRYRLISIDENRLSIIGINGETVELNFKFDEVLSLIEASWKQLRDDIYRTNPNLDEIIPQMLNGDWQHLL